MLNKAMLIGRLGRDPDVFTFDNNRKKTSFTLATTKTFKNKDGEKVTKTVWHNIVCFTPLAEVAESYLKKGALVYIGGEINVRKYEDKDNNERTITEIVAEQLQMLGGRKDAEQSDSGSDEPDPITNGGDDLPF